MASKKKQAAKAGAGAVAAGKAVKDNPYVQRIVEDEANDPSRMAQIAQRFVTQDHVDAIIGGTNDGTAQVLS